jgi:outer membrane protein assembly factor BamB
VFVSPARRAGGGATPQVDLYGRVGPARDDSAQRWVVYRLDRKTGKVVWERSPLEGKPRRPAMSTYANSTPATDGKHVVVSLGSDGLYNYDWNGRLVWKKDLKVLQAVPNSEGEFASSPVIDDGVVYVQADVLNGGFLAAFDLRDGREIWRTPRQDDPTWSSPTVHEVAGRKLVLVNARKQTGAYDARTGTEVWKLRGGGDVPVPTPFVADGLVYVAPSGSPIYAVKGDKKGDVSRAGDARSNHGVAWSIDQGGAYMPTPVVYQGLLYLCQNNGVLTVYRARTGERVYQKRLGAGTAFTASLVASDGKIYVSSEDGDVYVVKAGESFELLAKNAMGEVVMTTAAIADGTLFFRTRSRVVAVATR